MAVKRQVITDRYAIFNGDCIDGMANLPDESVHGIIYSPPFAGLYHYSSDERDLSNNRDRAEFFDHYRFVINQTWRLLKPGRTVAVHAAMVPSGNSGRDSYMDFPGDVIRAHQAADFDLIAKHTIWKEPLAVRNRTMQHNLSHRTIVEDGCLGGVAAADELLIFRKPGTSEPVTHPNGLFGEYAGDEQPPAELAKYRKWDGDQKLNRWSHWIWRRYASSVWDDIRISRVLPFREAKDEDDEKHVHPLQLDVIERYVDLRTMPGETVLTPFMGVGSEVFVPVRMGRRGIGFELKPTYFTQAVRNMQHVDDATGDEPEPSLFDTDGGLA